MTDTRDHTIVTICLYISRTYDSFPAKLISSFKKRFIISQLTAQGSKKIKNFANLCNHEVGFGLQEEWNVFLLATKREHVTK